MPRTTPRLAVALAGTMLASALVAGPVAATGTTPNPSPTTSAPTTPTPLAFRNSCSPRKATLPRVVEGSPRVKPGDPTGLYVWHDRKGWRVRLTHNLPKGASTGKPKVIEVRGRITASKPIRNLRTVRLEAKQREWVAVHRPARKVADFRFVNVGFIDGINSTAGCAGRVTVDVWQVTRSAHGRVVRTPLPVYVGAKKVPVSSAAGVLSQTSDITKVMVLRRPVK